MEMKSRNIVFHAKRLYFTQNAGVATQVTVELNSATTLRCYKGNVEAGMDVVAGDQFKIR